MNFDYCLISLQLQDRSFLSNSNSFYSTHYACFELYFIIIVIIITAKLVIFDLYHCYQLKMSHFYFSYYLVCLN